MRFIFLAFCFFSILTQVASQALVVGSTAWSPVTEAWELITYPPNQRIVSLFMVDDYLYYSYVALFTTSKPAFTPGFSYTVRTRRCVGCSLDQGWQTIGTTVLTQIDAKSQKLIIGTDKCTNFIKRYFVDTTTPSNSRWVTMAGVAISAAIAQDGAMWVVGTAGDLYRWNGGATPASWALNSWVRVNTPAGVSFSTVVIGSAGTSNLLIVSTAKEVYRCTATLSWNKMPLLINTNNIIEPLMSVTTQSYGYIFAVSETSNMFVWSQKNGLWRQLVSPPAPMTDIFAFLITVGPTSTVYFYNTASPYQGYSNALAYTCSYDWC